MRCHDTCCHGDDQIEVITLKRRSVSHTRKDHTCDLCFHVIPAGSYAYYEVALVDGELTAIYRHSPYGEGCALIPAEV